MGVQVRPVIRRVRGRDLSVGYALLFPGFLCAQITCVTSDTKTH